MRCSHIPLFKNIGTTYIYQDVCFGIYAQLTSVPRSLGWRTALLPKGV